MKLSKIEQTIQALEAEIRELRQKYEAERIGLEHAIDRLRKAQAPKTTRVRKLKAVASGENA